MAVLVDATALACVLIVKLLPFVPCVGERISQFALLFLDTVHVPLEETVITLLEACAGASVHALGVGLSIGVCALLVLMLVLTTLSPEWAWVLVLLAVNLA